VSKLGDVFNTPVKCCVKAVGDGKIFLDSEYTEEITFIKLPSVENAYIEDEVLYFDGIENVASYSVEVFSNNQLLATRTVTDDTFNANKISLNIEEFTDSLNGAEYLLKIKADEQGYNGLEGVSVFEGAQTELNYTVVGAVTNLSIGNSVLSWDFVKNAQTYTVELYNNGEFLNRFENIENNFLELTETDAGKYSCKVLANSNNPNTTTGKEFSQELSFEILDAPEFIINSRLYNLLHGVTVILKA
jgi:hypothetical protein